MSSYSISFIPLQQGETGTVAAQWLMCVTNRKVAGLIPAGVTGIFHGPGVDSTSNRNKYQEYSLGVKVAGA